MPRAYRPIVATASPAYISLFFSFSLFLSLFLYFKRNCGSHRADDRHDQSERFPRARARYDPRSRPTRLSKNIHKLRTKSTWNSQNHNLSGARIIIVRSHSHRRQFYSTFFPLGESTRLHRIERSPGPPNTAAERLRRRNSTREALTGHPAVRFVATLRQTVTYCLNVKLSPVAFLSPPYFLRHRFSSRDAIRYARFAISWFRSYTHSAALYTNDHAKLIRII